MISLDDITSFDVIIVVLFLFFVIRGTWVGFMRQVSFFLGLAVSYILAGKYAGQLMPYVGNFISNQKAVFFISFALLFLLGTIFFILLGKVLQLVMQVTLEGWFDRMLGFFLGLFKAGLVASFLYMIMNSGPSTARDLVKKSITSEYLAAGAVFVQELINDPKLREKFTPKPPAIIFETKPLPSPSELFRKEEEKEQKEQKEEKPLIDSDFFKEW